MQVLILGWSDIVRRRVIPALDTLATVTAIHVATSAIEVDLATATTKPGVVFTGDWRRALEALPDALVYVSGINTVHGERILAALESGHDVIVDKPAVLTESERSACLGAALSRGLLLAEATVWPMHAQVTRLTDQLSARGLTATRIDSLFTIPALPDTNFRTQVEAGGGCVADMGAYAMSPGRVFGTGEVTTISADLTQRDEHGLDLGFTISAEYSDGLIMEGLFSFGREYANRLSIGGVDWSATLEPAFSSKPDAQLSVALTIAGEDGGFIAPPCDPFEVFLRSVIADASEGRRIPHTEHTAKSTADLLALAAAAGLEWPDPLH